MITALEVISIIFIGLSMGMAGWSMLTEEPRFMTGALGLVWLSMVYASGQAAYQRHWLALGFGIAGALVAGLVAWRSWPDCWNPWHTMRDFIERARLTRS